MKHYINTYLVHQTINAVLSAYLLQRHTQQQQQQHETLYQYILSTSDYKRCSSGVATTTTHIYNNMKHYINTYLVLQTINAVLEA